MKNHCATIVLAWATAFAGLCVTLARADEASYAVRPRHGVLLLTNGELISGDITPAGDRYDVAGQGSELRIKVSDVRLVATSAVECYDYQRDHMEEVTARARLELADWCLRQGLLQPARREIDAARQVNPDHPDLGRYEMRWKLAAEPVSDTPHASAPPAERVSPEELDRLVRSLPDGCMETFTSTVQPILLNHCSNSGCHSPSSHSGDMALRLIRAPGKQSISRRATQRNLLSVLATIDREHPDESPLLTTPKKAHGDSKAPTFSGRNSAQLEQMAAWVRLAASRRDPPADHPATVDGRESATLLQSASRLPRSLHPKPTDLAPPPDTDATTEKPSSRAFGVPYSPDQDKESPSEAPKSLNLGAKQQRGANLSGEFVPRDPFDPEIFNRRYLPRLATPDHEPVADAPPAK